MPDILILGEAWSEEEALYRQPFVGKSGWLINQLLEEADIKRHECFLTNVFNRQPQPTPETAQFQRNDVRHFCGPKHGLWPALMTGKYVRPEFAPEFERLAKEIDEANPNIIIALGATALWALTGSGGISRSRGTITQSNHTILKTTRTYKVLPTYHPAALLRDLSNREIVVLDLIKAKRESTFPEIIRPKRTIAIFPTVQELWELLPVFRGAKSLACDIETHGDQITCIGFAPSKSYALVVPFFDYRRPDNSYWRTPEEEVSAWQFVQQVLWTDAIKIFQNGLYDLAFLWRRMGMTVRNAGEDTMLLHHALQPEMLKGLGFLGSLYTNEASWKSMRTKNETIKREE